MFSDRKGGKATMDANLAKVARQLNLRNGVGRIPPVVLMTDTVRLPDPISALSRIPRGSLVIFRHYDHPDRNKIAFETRRACRHFGHLFSVAGDVMLAEKLGVDGIHLSGKRIDPLLLNYMKADKGRLILTASVHNAKQWLQLRRTSLPLEGLILSPVFPTLTHPDAKTMDKRVFRTLAAWARRNNCNAIALGGINTKTVHSLSQSPISAIAGIGFAK